MQSVPIPYLPNPLLYFHCLKHLPNFIWLDSGRPMSTQGRYDIFTGSPVSTACIRADGQLAIDDELVMHTDADSALERWLYAHTQPDEQLPKDLPFVGGVIGYFGYRWQHAAFGLPSARKESLPIAELFAVDWSLVIDHKDNSAWFIVQDDGNNSRNSIGPDSISESSNHKYRSILSALEKLQTNEDKQSLFDDFSCGTFSHQTSKTDYLAALTRIHDYILAGDCYQTNFSQRFSAPYSGDLGAAYCRLRQATPSPYSAYISGQDTQILCVSPERFLHIEGSMVTTQPIKGTSPRGKNPDEDKALAEALIASEKNRAENVMIVDLLRNDLSQCCEPFSVQVPKLCELHTFANVHHLISTVTGTLAQGYSAFELFRRSFPGGSITGAPKKRSMEIIHELERNERGIYCGSIAYFSKNNRHDSNIAIRTMQADDKNLYCWGGGGIVADSNNEEEYAESIVKVKKLMDALTTQQFS